MRLYKQIENRKWDEPATPDTDDEAPESGDSDGDYVPPQDHDVDEEED